MYSPEDEINKISFVLFIENLLEREFGSSEVVILDEEGNEVDIVEPLLVDVANAFVNHNYTTFYSLVHTDALKPFKQQATEIYRENYS